MIRKYIFRTTLNHSYYLYANSTPPIKKKNIQRLTLVTPTVDGGKLVSLHP